MSSSGKRDQRKKLRSIRQKPIDIQESVRTVQIISDEAWLAKTKKGSSEDEPLKQDGGVLQRNNDNVTCAAFPFGNRRDAHIVAKDNVNDPALVRRHRAKLNLVSR